MTIEQRLTLETCVCGECFDCPDGWHGADELPCSCTADCALDAKCRSCGEPYTGYGDGWDGECGECADATAIANGEIDAD